MPTLTRLLALVVVAIALGSGSTTPAPTGVLAGPGPSICC